MQDPGNGCSKQCRVASLDSLTSLRTHARECICVEESEICCTIFMLSLSTITFFYPMSHAIDRPSQTAHSEAWGTEAIPTYPHLPVPIFWYKNEQSFWKIITKKKKKTTSLVFLVSQNCSYYTNTIKEQNIEFVHSSPLVKKFGKCHKISLNFQVVFYRVTDDYGSAFLK